MALMKLLILTLVQSLILSCAARDKNKNQPHPEKNLDYVVFEPIPESFSLVTAGNAVPILLNNDDFPGVVRATKDLQSDIAKVTSIVPNIIFDDASSLSNVLIVGTIGKSRIIEELIRNGKLNVDDIKGKWETFLTTSIENPFPGVESALVIAGSDQRATIFGIYDLSYKMGVSPWHFWDDVPPIKRNNIYVVQGRHTLGEPAVKYRGFFINDENPNLGTWGPDFFGKGHHPQYPNGFNKELYSKVFEVMLRLKANYLWPAVWGRAFAEDDPENHATAKLYGIVMGTSHEAPMMRGIEEWNRNVTPAKRDEHGAIIEAGNDPYGGTGEWRYSKNPTALEKYWRYGIQLMVNEDFEGIVTLGMRGPGDVGLPKEDGIDLIERVIEKQRSIISEVTGKNPIETPQVWTLYKEILDYWEAGIRVPDDVTVVWCDDNWGNMRKLPDLSLPKRTGGYGLYYHFDYVGGGRNYKWVDTNNLANIWEQLHLSYQYGVDRLWVVNVGDLKNEEFPLEFFLDYAWNPDLIPIDKLHEWELSWASKQFGKDFGDEIAKILATYGKLQSNRKPELLNRKISLNPDFDITQNPNEAVVYEDGSPFSLINYREMERVTSQWQQLAQQASNLRSRIPENFQDAYYQLVYYQVKASALMYELRLAGFKNLLYKKQERSATNDMAHIAQQKFNESTAMAEYYNTELSGGKWHNWQLQPYLAYGGDYPNSSWQQPETNYVADPDFIWPELVNHVVPIEASMGVAIDGSEKVWPQEVSPAILPKFSPYQNQTGQYIEVFNRGSTPFNYKIEVGVPWIIVEPQQGKVEKEVRVEISIDWTSVPIGTSQVPITIKGPSEQNIIVDAEIENLPLDLQQTSGFVESNGYISMEASHFTRKVDQMPIFWQKISGIGRTGDGMTPFPVTATRQTITEDSPRLEFDFHIFNAGDVEIFVYLSPRNDVLYGEGLKYGISINDHEPQIINVTEQLNGIPMNKSWERNTSNNLSLSMSHHSINEVGRHVLKFWMIDPTVIIQKIVINTGGLKESYLGPPESWNALLQN